MTNFFLESGKELSPKRSIKSPGSPERSVKDQMQQIRFETHSPTGSPNRDREREKRRAEKERDRELARERQEREHEREKRSAKFERDFELSPSRNRSASFDDRRGGDDQYQDEEEDEEYYDDRRGRRTDGWMNRSYGDDKFGAIYKDAVELRYTVPDPFAFDTREKVRAKSIRERKVEEMVREKQLEEERMMKHQFRAKSVPKIVKEPL